jgi:hypothetical protein
LREQIKPHTREVKRILVFFDGVDVDTHTGLAIEVLAAMNRAWYSNGVIDTQYSSRE